MRIGIGVALVGTKAPSGVTPPVPVNAIQQRDGAYILDRAGDYIEVRA